MWPVLLRILFWAALLAALIVATLLEPVQAGASDKVQHAVGFAALTAMGLLAYPAAPLWKLAVGLSAFGLLIELLQGLPAVGRDADALDWLADCLGILAVLLVAALRRTDPGKLRSGG